MTALFVAISSALAHARYPARMGDLAMHIALPTLVLIAALTLVAWAEDEPRPDLQPGSAAPAWRLNDHEGRARAFATEGKDTWIILAFFPKAATPG